MPGREYLRFISRCNYQQVSPPCHLLFSTQHLGHFWLSGNISDPMPEPAAAPAQGEPEESNTQKWIKIGQVRSRTKLHLWK